MEEYITYSQTKNYNADLELNIQQLCICCFPFSLLNIHTNKMVTLFHYASTDIYPAHTLFFS